MKEVLFIRHGQTQANLDGVLCGGEWDIPLILSGKTQAQEFADKFSAQLKDADHAYCSPLIRARQTWDIINQKLTIPTTYAPAFREWDIGEWNQKSYATVGDFFGEKKDAPMGETYAQFHSRIFTEFEQLLKLDFSKIIIIAHGCVGRLLVSHLAQHNQWPENGCLTQLIQKDNHWRLQFYK